LYKNLDPKPGPDVICERIRVQNPAFSTFPEERSMRNIFRRKILFPVCHDHLPPSAIRLRRLGGKARVKVLGGYLFGPRDIVAGGRVLNWPESRRIGGACDSVAALGTGQFQNLAGANTARRRDSLAEMAHLRAFFFSESSGVCHNPRKDKGPQNRAWQPCISFSSTAGRFNFGMGDDCFFRGKPFGKPGLHIAGASNGM